MKPSCLPLVLALFLAFVSAGDLGAVLVYQEDFDDGSADGQAVTPEVCWDNTYCPVSSNTPLCMSGRTLRTNSSTLDPIIGIDLRDCTGSATLHYTYYQFAYAAVTVEQGSTASGFLDCLAPSPLVDFATLSVIDACMDETVPLVSGEINYVRWDHGYNSNALWIDDLWVDATCDTSCITSFSCDFGTFFQSGTVCSIWPDLWENCQGTGPYITSGGLCGGAGDYVMYLASGYPYSSADTVCIDLAGAASPTLRYAYAWDGPAVLSPSIEISADGGGFADFVASHEDTGGACADACVSLADYIGHEVVLRFTSNYSGTDYYAQFDDISIQADDVCPVDTVDASMTCLPSSGTVPFVCTLTITLENIEPTRPACVVAAGIDVVLANGSGFSNWKSGSTTIPASGIFSTSWNQVFPALGSVIGDNIFTLTAEDVTPAPYNQPPYPPSGDTATAVCTVTAAAP